MNYYEVLGVSESASVDEIKKSYRQKSMKYHPDRNSDSNAAEKMGEINEAYEVLGDANKRRLYDMEKSLSMGGNAMNIHDIMSGLFGMGGINGINGMGGLSGMSGMGGINVEGPEVHFFSGSMNDIFEQMNRPPPVQQHIYITLEESFFGSNRKVEVERWSIINRQKIRENVKVEIYLQPGIQHHEVITIENQGNRMNERIIGNIEITVVIQEHDVFKRINHDLIYNKTISLKEALCGFSFELHHLNRKTYLLNNEKNHMIISPGYRQTVNGLGFQRGNQCGNLIIVFSVKFPESICEEKLEQLKNIL